MGRALFLQANSPAILRLLGFLWPLARGENLHLALVVPKAWESLSSTPPHLHPSTPPTPDLLLVNPCFGQELLGCLLHVPTSKASIPLQGCQLLCPWLPGNPPKLTKFSQHRQDLSWGHCHHTNPQQPSAISFLPSLDLSTGEQTSVRCRDKASRAGVK